MSSVFLVMPKYPISYPQIALMRMLGAQSHLKSHKKRGCFHQCVILISPHSTSDQVESQSKWCLLCCPAGLWLQVTFGISYREETKSDCSCNFLPKGILLLYLTIFNINKINSRRVGLLSSFVCVRMCYMSLHQ